MTAAALRPLLAVKAKLDAADDKLSSALAEIEEGLAPFSGVTVETFYESATTRGPVLLAWEKVNAQQWAITFLPDGEAEPRRLRDAARDIRAEVWLAELGPPPIEALLERLKAVLEEGVLERAEALQSVAALRKCGYLP